jgi:hypothetical protein
VFKILSAESVATQRVAFEENWPPLQINGVVTGLDTVRVPERKFPAVIDPLLTYNSCWSVIVGYLTKVGGLVGSFELLGIETTKVDSTVKFSSWRLAMLSVESFTEVLLKRTESPL